MDLTDSVTPPTVQAIYKHYEAQRKNGNRPHLGGSQIGNECERALWYQFRHAGSRQIEGRILRLFETGDREESRIVANLRAIGVTVWDRDPDTGKQIAFSSQGGHFGLSLDGVGTGFAESTALHTLEYKTMNDKAFKAISKDGLQKSKPVYWAQCQVGMHLADIDRCYFFAVNKNDDSIYAERVKLDKAEAMMLIAKAGRVIFAEKPPAKINDNPAFFLCKFCDYWDVCHGGRPPDVNCRTCAHATPEQNGTWSCAAGKAFGTACEGHLYNPYAMPWPISDAGDDWIEYTDAVTGEVIRNAGNSEAILAAWAPF